MTDMFRDLKNGIKVNLQADENGFIGRECPETACESYFKIKPGTGLPDATECICPYCGHQDPQSHFFTKEQIEYGKSVALRIVADTLHKGFKKLETTHQPRSGFSISVNSPVKKAYFLRFKPPAESFPA